MGDFEEAKKRAAEEAEKAKRQAEQDSAAGLVRVRSLLVEFDGDCPDDYAAYEHKEDGKGGVILTHKKTGQKIHIESPSRGLYRVNRGNNAKQTASGRVDAEGDEAVTILSPRETEYEGSAQPVWLG